MFRRCLEMVEQRLRCKSGRFEAHGGGADWKVGGVAKNTVNVTLALGSDRLLMGGARAEIRLSHRETLFVHRGLFLKEMTLVRSDRSLRPVCPLVLLHNAAL
jgi:hypothetical protein